MSSRAGTMGASVAAAAGRSEKSLKAVRNISLGLVAVFAAAVYASSKFETAMSGVKAATGAAGKELNQLRQAAIEAGSSTQYSATQAAGAETELAKAGVSTSDVLGGALKGTLNLAAAGQLDVADSAVVAAKAMNAFGLQGADVGHIADVIAAAAGKSATDVHGMSLAFAQSALMAHQTGLSLEQTAGSLALFAQNGLVGSDAGTSLKTMLMRLTPQSAEAADMMNKLGFSAYDSSGNFVGLTETAARMKASFSKLTPEARNAAFATIFGSDATRAATIVYKSGAAGIDTWTKAANDSGYASRYAATQADNLSGDLHKLKSALETALIQSGSAANGVLRGMAKTLTDVVRWYNALPPGVQKSVTVMGGLVGVVGLVGAGFLLMLPRIMAVRAELVRLGVTAAGTRTAMMALGRMTIVLGALAALSYASNKLSDAMKATPPNVTKLTAELVKLGQSGKAAAAGTSELDGFGESVARIAHPAVLDRITDVGSSIMHLGGDSTVFGISEARDQISALDDALAQLVESGNSELAAKAFAAKAKEAEAEGTSIEKLRTLLPKYGDALTAADTQQKLTAGSQKDLGDEAATTADALADQRSEAERLTDALNALNGVNVSEAEAAISFRQSLADLKKEVHDSGHSLDITSEKGRKVKGAFLDAAKAAQAHAQAVADRTKSEDKGRAALAADISALKATMKQAGFTDAQINHLIKTYAKLPAKSATQVKAETGQAQHDLEAVQAKVKGTKGKTIEVKTLTALGQKALEDLGYKIKRTKGKNVVITVPTGTQKANVDALAAAIRALHDKSVVIKTTHYNNTVTSGGGLGKKNAASAQANGSVLDFYASGGMRENHVAQFARAGAWRVWAEDETGGEAYIPLAASKRPRSRKIAAETVKRLGGQVQWFAGGGIPGFTYTPTGQAVLNGSTDPMSRYDQEIADLKNAWADLTKALAAQKKAADSLRAAEKNLAAVRKGHHTAAQLRAAEERVDKAKSAKRATDKTVGSDRQKVYAADKELGLKKGAKAPTSFNLKAYETQLDESVHETEKWRKNLTKIGQRGGTELQAMLEGMGQEGYALVNALAGASDKQFKEITAKLQKTGELAKATLADFTKQLGASTKESQQFAADLQKLASQGFGDLAQALAAQGDASAMALAHEAAGNSKSAATANTQVGKAQNTLTGDDLANSLVLLSTLRGGPGRGFADLIAAGLDTATIRALVPKMTAQIGSLPAANKDTFVRQWVGQGGKAMARGGILSHPTMVLGGEAGVRESWIPWNGSARSRSLLAATAAAQGYQLVPVGRYSGGGSSVQALAREVSKQITVNLYSAKQTAAEQAHDIGRIIAFVG